MAIPVYLQSFKAAGIYRVVFDKSTIANVDTEILRLVVGYSEQGPFNTPVYVKSPAEFTMLFGNISKKLEKRGIFFHRLALQMLNAGPILCLNLKKFNGETVEGSTISTDFDDKFTPIISTVKLNIEDIYDTTRFWELNANKLNGLRSVEGKVLDKYINIAATNTDKKSISYFIRKASGQKVAGYNITVNDWFSDRQEEMPDFLADQKHALISDFFAEIYVFKGKFDKKQILSSETLKNYFTYDTESNNVKLKEKIFNAWGEPVDTLDALYFDDTSGALGHYVGALIPFFKNKQGAYISLDIAFNNDINIHNAMLSFNTDLLDEKKIDINLSGKNKIIKDESNTFLKDIKEGNINAKTTLLGNNNSPIISDTITFGANIIKNNKPIIDFYTSKNNINGTLYVSKITNIKNEEYSFMLNQVTPICNNEEVEDDAKNNQKNNRAKFEFTDSDDLDYALNKFGITKINDIYIGETYKDFDYTSENAKWPFFDKTSEDYKVTLEGPTKIITSISKLHEEINYAIKDGIPTYTFPNFGTVASKTEDSTEAVAKIIAHEDSNPDQVNVLLSETASDYVKEFSVNIIDVDTETQSTQNGNNINPVYGSSLSFIKNDNYTFVENFIINGLPFTGLICKDEKDSAKLWDKSLLATLQKGDCLLAADNLDDDNNDNYYDNVFVLNTGIGTIVEVESETNKKVNKKVYFIELTGKPETFIYCKNPAKTDDTNVNESYIIRLDNSINQEIGEMRPIFLEGYTYKNANPTGTNMWAKVEWQNLILSTLTDYKGLRTALLNKSEIDYRYVVDTFQSFPVSNLKNVLSFLCKEKQSALCIANFPAVKTFVKCPYTSFTDEKGIFNVNYVVKGYNKKKSAGERFSIPSDSDGASFVAFYTPLKFSDGYIDTIVPAAGLVSNLFVQKYLSRQPYYIVAGPNYGSITAPGLVGPDYKYSMDELQIIEPFGVNCMVYRPNFGTFINANQTAKQIPLSALSKVNVRELVIYLQDEVEKVLQSYQWEFNNQVTRNAILDKVNYICELIKANGGLLAYKNIMDDSNNTPEIIDNEMAILSTHIEPGMGCGKMVHELSIYKTGYMQASIKD